MINDIGRCWVNLGVWKNNCTVLAAGGVGEEGIAAEKLRKSWESWASAVFDFKSANLLPNMYERDFPVVKSNVFHWPV
jgi:hypothetical protein